MPRGEPITIRFPARPAAIEPLPEDIRQSLKIQRGGGASIMGLNGHEANTLSSVNDFQMYPQNSCLGAQSKQSCLFPGGEYRTEERAGQGRAMSSLLFITS